MPSSNTAPTASDGPTLTTVAPVDCRSCGEPVPSGARFCPSCGQPVSFRAAEERRVVTVVFADLAGFTALSEGRDPEAVKELLDACFGMLVPVIEVHGGHVDKIIGDELMALFGAPVAHDDDPERAVRAALGLLEALGRLNPDLVLRVGVNTGEVLAGPVGPGHAYTVTGDTVNTAHRLVSVAQGGEILCGERTWTATNHAIRYQQKPPYRLRGKQAAVRAWSAIGMLHPADRPTGAATTSGQIFGRDWILGQLTTMARACFADRQAVVAALTGEPGIGKSRLAGAIDDALAELPHRTLWARCPPYGHANPVEPVAALARAALGVDPDTHPDAQRRRVADAAPMLADVVGADRALLTSRMTQLLGLEPGPVREDRGDTGPMRARVVDELFAAARLVLESTATRQPTVVVVDDLHWADDALLSFLELLPSRVGAVPLFIVLVARDQILERRPRLASGNELIAPFPLGPLTDEASRALLAHLLSRIASASDGARGAPDVVIGPGTEQRLLDAAGGNPLLLEEVVRYLDDTDAVFRTDGQVRIALATGEAQLPDGVRAVIGARLDALPADERRYLLDAAVIGSRFWSDAVQAIGEHATPHETVQRLLRKGLVERARDSSEGDLAFRQVLTRDVAYAAVPIGERATRHAAAARWLEHEFPDEAVGPMIRLVAHHYDRAVMLGRELEHSDPGLANAAFRALVQAGREAERHEILRDAEHWYARALALGSVDQTAVLDATLAYGLTLVKLHRLDEALGQFELVRRDAGPGRPALRATATGRLAVAARLRGDLDAARQWFDDAQRQWRELGDLAGEAATLRMQGWAELTVGRPRQARPRLLRAADLERQGPQGHESADTLRNLGWCEFLVGNFDAARVALWEAALRFSEVGDLGAMAWCWAILAFSFLQSGDVDRTLEITQNMAELARAQGDSWSEATCALLTSVAMATCGQLGEATVQADVAERMFRELDDLWGLAMIVLARGIIDRFGGRWAAARRHLLDGLELARRVEWVAEESRLLTELATVELQAGNQDEARRRARAALALVRTGIGDHESELRALCVLGEVSRSRGDLAEAQLVLEEAAGPADHAPATTTLGWALAQATLAELLVECDDLDSAELRAARAREAGDGSAEVHTRAVLALAEVASARGQVDRARRLLNDALERWEGERLAFLEPVRERLGQLRL